MLARLCLAWKVMFFKTIAFICCSQRYMMVENCDDDGSDGGCDSDSTGDGCDCMCELC